MVTEDCLLLLNNLQILFLGGLDGINGRVTGQLGVAGQLLTDLVISASHVHRIKIIQTLFLNVHKYKYYILYIQSIFYPLISEMALIQKLLIGALIYLYLLTQITCIINWLTQYHDASLLQIYLSGANGYFHSLIN